MIGFRTLSQNHCHPGCAAFSTLSTMVMILAKVVKNRGRASFKAHFPSGIRILSSIHPNALLSVPRSPENAFLSGSAAFLMWSTTSCIFLSTLSNAVSPSDKFPKSTAEDAAAAGVLPFFALEGVELAAALLLWY